MVLIKTVTDSEKCVLFFGDQSAMNASRGVEVDPIRSAGFDNGVIYIRVKHYTDGEFIFFSTDNSDDAQNETSSTIPVLSCLIKSCGALNLFAPDGSTIASCKTGSGYFSVDVFTDGKTFPDVVGVVVSAQK